MISGSLMLDEKYNCTKEKLKKHIFKMIIFFISWSLIYSFAHQIINISKNLLQKVKKSSIIKIDNTKVCIKKCHMNKIH